MDEGWVFRDVVGCQNRTCSQGGNVYTRFFKLKYIFLCDGFSANTEILNICLSPNLSMKNLSWGSRVEEATVKIR